MALQGRHATASRHSGELLEQVDGRVPLVIEIKSRWDGNEACPPRCRGGSRTTTGPFAFMSFDPKVIASLHGKSHRDIARGIVADRATHSDYDDLPRSASGCDCANSSICRETRARFHLLLLARPPLPARHTGFASRPTGDLLDRSQPARRRHSVGAIATRSPSKGFARKPAAP